MFRVVICTGLVLVVGVAFAASPTKEGESVKVLSTKKISETLDGSPTTATTVEVTIQPGESGVPHRHPGPGFGYIIEGEYELAIDDQPVQKLKAGDTFYEPAGCLHRISRNPGKVPVRLIAVVLHPQDQTEIALPESSHP